MAADPWGGAYVYLYKGGDEIENFSIDDSPSGYPNGSTETIRGYIERTHGVVPYNVDSVVIQRWAGNIYTTYDALIASNFYENGDINIVLNVSGGIDEFKAQYIMDGDKKIGVAPNIIYRHSPYECMVKEAYTNNCPYGFIRHADISGMLAYGYCNKCLIFPQSQVGWNLPEYQTTVQSSGSASSTVSYNVYSCDGTNRKVIVTNSLPANPESGTYYFII